MAELYPPIEPYDQGLLDVGDGNHVYWATWAEPGRQARLMLMTLPARHRRRY